MSMARRGPWEGNGGNGHGKACRRSPEGQGANALCKQGWGQHKQQHHHRRRPGEVAGSWQLAATHNARLQRGPTSKQRRNRRRSRAGMLAVWDRVNNPHSVQGTARRRRHAPANGEARRAAARMPCPGRFTILGASHTTDWQTADRLAHSLFFPPPSWIMDHPRRIPLRTLHIAHLHIVATSWIVTAAAFAR
jgi:hypothetical protein